ncbi:MAG TPA: SHOCT domain-containing protein [Anaerolineales bacterium]|nr:SHOCT domain-containing protein [Anaerolineales bacterium]HNQ95547.1 SHOCT domain-containing protein [Anaerolineales bacterium]HNS62654.1 SHOCT domain-containing protein [Anaerolineales bacterium]
MTTNQSPAMTLSIQQWKIVSDAIGEYCSTRSNDWQKWGNQTQQIIQSAINKSLQSGSPEKINITLNDQSWQTVSLLMSSYKDKFPVSLPFLSDFNIVEQEIIKGENILWVGNIAQFNNTSGIDRYPFGYLILTQQRIVRVLFHAEYENDLGGNILVDLLAPVLIPVLLVAALASPKAGDPTFGKVRAYDPKKKRQEISVLNSNHVGHSHSSYLKVPPTTPLTNRELTSRAVRLFPFTNLTNVDRFETQDDHTGEKIIELDIRFVPDETMQIVFYKEQDGKNVYDILLDRLQGNAQSIKQIPAISEQLEKLAELHKAQVLTDAEFEAAKKRLLEK